MIKDTIKILNWFGTFSYVDIDELSDEEKSSLMITIIELSSQLLFEPQINSASDGISVTGGSLSKRRELRLRDIQAWFKDNFFKIMNTISDAHKKEIKEWTSDKQLFEGFAAFPDGEKYGHILEPFFINLLPEEQINLANLSVSATIGIEPEYKTANGKAYARWDPEWRKKSPIRVSAHLDLRYGLFFAFLKSINGLPPDAFCWCEGCEKWYFHLSKRERKYCSEKCTKKMQARRRREREKKAQK